MLEVHLIILREWIYIQLRLNFDDFYLIKVIICLKKKTRGVTISQYLNVM